MKTQDLVKRVEFVIDKNSPLLKQSGYTPEAYARVALNALVMNPDIGECDVLSIDRAFIQCMNAGLQPDGNEAAIIPFKKQAVLIPMVEGRVKMARQATPGISLRARAVYEGDDWEYHEGMRAVINHTPNPAASNHPDNLIWAYALAFLPGSQQPEYDVMSRSVIDRYRSYSLSKSGGPWETHFEEMSKNAVLKRLLKRLPKSSRDPMLNPSYHLPAELEHVNTIDDVKALATGQSPIDPVAAEMIHETEQMAIAAAAPSIEEAKEEPPGYDSPF